MKSSFQQWSDVRVFLAVMRHGSTLAASRDLGIAQPTVSRRVDALENDLGLPLFERDTRGFQPTDAARALLPFAESMENDAALLAGEARRLGAHLGPIRVTTAPTGFGVKFQTIFSEFTRAHPGSRFEFLSSDRPLDLIAGEADVAIRHGQVFDDDTLICRKLSEGRFALYAARSYQERHGIPRSIEALRKHAYIALDGPNMPRQLAKWTSEQVDPACINMTCSDWPSLVAAIQAGVGIGPMGTTQGDHYEDLVRCFTLPPEMDYKTMLLVSPQAYRRKDVKAFTAFFAPRYAAMSRAERGEDP